jgi:hypothetical protein
MEYHKQMRSDRSQTDGRPENSESQARPFLPNSLIASQRKARSSLVRRLVQARDDPAKQRIRRWLGKINDEQLLSFGLTPEDIALLRSSCRAGKFVSTLLSVPSPPGSWF